MAFTFAVQAGKSGGGTTTTGGFTFSYNVGTVANYHAYGVACQVGYVSPQPKGTIVLENYWVWDLGPVTGTGKVACPKPVVPKGQSSSVLGLLLFANAAAIGAHATPHPVVLARVFKPQRHSGDARLAVV